MEATSLDAVSNAALYMRTVPESNTIPNQPLAFFQVLHLPVNPMSSSVKTVAVHSNFGAATETMTVRITQMKPTAVSLRFFCETVKICLKGISKAPLPL